MPPKQSVTLTEAELRIMEVLWHHGASTVQQVVDWLPADLAYNSVLTTIRILEKKGHVKHIKDGRAYIYESVVGRDEASRSEIRHLLSRFFRNSHEALLLNILQDEEINRDQIKRLREMLDQHELDQHKSDRYESDPDNARSDRRGSTK